MISWIAVSSAWSPLSLQEVISAAFVKFFVLFFLWEISYLSCSECSLSLRHNSSLSMQNNGRHVFFFVAKPITASFLGMANVASKKQAWLVCGWDACFVTAHYSLIFTKTAPRLYCFSINADLPPESSHLFGAVTSITFDHESSDHDIRRWKSCQNNQITNLQSGWTFTPKKVTLPGELHCNDPAITYNTLAFK